MVCVIDQVSRVESMLDLVDSAVIPELGHLSLILALCMALVLGVFPITGGIRGKKQHAGTYHPRSFNMGISKKAFEASNGFGRIHPGEDPDLTIRLWNLGFETKLISKAFVYHKRRISWKSFYKQVFKFGMVRPILNTWHPQTKKVTYWFPTVFCVGLIISIALFFVQFKWLLFCFVLYFLLTNPYSNFL